MNKIEDKMPWELYTKEELQKFYSTPSKSSGEDLTTKELLSRNIPYSEIKEEFEIEDE